MCCIISGSIHASQCSNLVAVLARQQGEEFDGLGAHDFSVSFQCWAQNEPWYRAELLVVYHQTLKEAVWLAMQLKVGELDTLNRVNYSESYQS